MALLWEVRYGSTQKNTKKSITKIPIKNLVKRRPTIQTNRKNLPPDSVQRKGETMKVPEIRMGRAPSCVRLQKTKYQIKKSLTILENSHVSVL